MTAASTKIRTASETALDLDHARRVLTAEMEGLRALSDSLNGDFSAAVEAVHTMKSHSNRAGRLIVAENGPQKAAIFARLYFLVGGGGNSLPSG